MLQRLLAGGAAVLLTCLSLAGWLGVRLTPAEVARDRLRADWQPSPVAARGPDYRPGGVVRGVPPASRESGQGAALERMPTPTPRPPIPSLPAPGTPVALPLAGQVDALPAETWSQDKAWLERALESTPSPVRGVLREVRFFSRALAREVAYLAWLPPGYGTELAPYPTLYLLHGAGNWESYGIEEWLGYALTEDLEGLLSLRLIAPMIVVLPEGEQGYWLNHAAGGPRWGDFVAIDLVQHVDATFRTDARRERRAIGGLSMGGHGALQVTLNHPDVFSIAGAHSPTLRPFELSPRFFGDESEFARIDPLTLVRTTDAAPRVLTWIDVGAEDRWRESTEELVQALLGKDAPFLFHVLAGEHEGWYWQTYLPVYLRFYSAALSARAWTVQGAPIVQPG